MEERLKKLEAKVAELEAWKKARIAQQLTYPLDKISTDIVQKDALIYISNLNFVRVDGIEVPNILVKHNGRVELISVYNQLQAFTVNASTNVFTSTAHGLADGQQVYFLSTGVLPSPLVDYTFYYIINASTDTFKVSATFGGAAVDITDTGTGTHFVFLGT